MPQFTCDLSAPSVPLHHVWSHTIGSNHARKALRADWQARMRRERHDDPYAAASVAKNSIDVAHLVHAYSCWTFAVCVTVARSDDRSVTALCANHAFPRHPSAEQVRRLQGAPELQADPLVWRRVDGHVDVEFDLSAPAVAAATLVF